MILVIIATAIAAFLAGLAFIPALDWLDERRARRRRAILRARTVNVIDLAHVRAVRRGRP